MPSMTLSRHIGAPIDRVWEVLDDFGGIHTWNPGVATSALTTDGPVGSGSERFCELKPAGVIQERITHHQPGERMTVHIYEMTKVPLKEGIADFRLTEAAGGTDVSIDYEY
ncbi:MAG: SRPBCC family protein, partial [Acidimicrobiia bacterium]|nr:SRPBCC family protein [Acidimicrobiia bacterium]